jgi:hypothetical protein
MTKTKEDKIKHLLTENHLNRISKEEMMNKAYEAGFEEFRVKAEEGVKKLESGYIDTSAYSSNTVLLRHEVLTTIKEIKQ